MSNMVGGGQAVVPPGNTPEECHHNQYEQYGETYTFESFISGFCIAFTPDFLSEMMEKDGFIFDPIFKVGGYEDNDLCVRALIAGYMPVRVLGCWLPHTCSLTMSKFDSTYQGVYNHSRFLQKWEKWTSREQRLVGAYRVSVRNVNALLQLKSSLMRSIPFLDGLSILLTSYSG